MYKMTLICVKYPPIIISVAILLNLILAYFGIFAEILNYLFGASLISIIPMYINSKTFKFCKYHRRFIDYILISQLLHGYDYYVGIPVKDLTLLIVYLIIAGIYLFATTYLYMKYGDRCTVRTPVKGIKRVCRQNGCRKFEHVGRTGCNPVKNSKSLHR